MAIDLKALRDFVTAAVGPGRPGVRLHPEVVLALLDRLEAAEKERDALQEVAGMYEWLRDCHIGDDPESINLDRAKRPGLDAAIKAAMAQEGGAEADANDGGWNAPGTRPEEPGEYEMESHWPHREVFRVRWDGERWMNIDICLEFTRGELCRWRKISAERGGS